LDSARSYVTVAGDRQPRRAGYKKEFGNGTGGVLPGMNAGKWWANGGAAMTGAGGGGGGGAGEAGGAPSPIRSTQGGGDELPRGEGGGRRSGSGRGRGRSTGRSGRSATPSQAQTKVRDRAAVAATFAHNRFPRSAHFIATDFSGKTIM
jgi:hypothetical protein